MEWLLAVASAIFGWAAHEFLPPLWRRVSRRPLLQVFVETDPAIIWAGAPPWIGVTYAVPDVSHLGDAPPKFCPDWHAWLQEHGAVSGGTTELEITLTSGTGATVVVDGIRAKVVNRRPLPPWTILMCAVGGADITPRRFTIELEGFDTPTTAFINEGSEPVRPPRFSLSSRDVEKLYITAEATSHYVEWTAELLAVVDGKRRVFPIDDAGRPFRTCGTRGLPVHTWDGDAWEPPLPAAK